MFDEFIEVVTTREELDELADVLVRACGFGCRYQDCELASGNPRWAALRGLRDRRFVLGRLFARRLRPHLQSEESGRERDC
jgi:hypothetical protein